MKIRVNGNERTLEAPLSVAALLAQMQQDPKRVAVERNREIVPQNVLATTMLADGDELEIVHFVGGG